MRTARGSSTPPGSRHPPPRPDPHPLWTEFLTHASENITLPQTSFAGGNDVTKWHAVKDCSFVPVL